MPDSESPHTEETGLPSDDSIPLDDAGDVRLPIVDVLTGRAFLTGKSGSGKSNSASVVAEELLDRGFPLLIVDTDGEYWGLKQEYEILHVGADEECDLQVSSEHAGKLAELALKDNVPIILDVSGYLDTEEANAVVRETAEALFHREKKLKKPFLMLVEEIHEYIPEGGGLDETGETLVRVAKRGRKRGLGLAGMSQRPADVKKDFITQANWLLWHRLTWDNDTTVVRRVLGGEYEDRVQDLADGEGFLQADFLEADVQQVQVRRKRTFDAGATPDLDDFERPDLKSVSGDLVDELEAISEAEERRQDRIGQLEARVEELKAEKRELEDQLEAAEQNNETVNRLAEQLATISAGEGGGEALEEIREEKNGRIRELEHELEDVRGERDEYRERAADLRAELDGRPEIGERAVEAVQVLADEFDVGSGDSDALRRKLKQARERIDELEQSQTRSGGNLDSDPLDNRKVTTVVNDIEQRLEALGEKEQQMLRYYIVNGPASAKDAYKYAGGSPTSSYASKKTTALADAGLLCAVGRGEYTFDVREHLDEVLGEFSEDKLDRVQDHVETAVYDHVMEPAPA